LCSSSPRSGDGSQRPTCMIRLPVTLRNIAEMFRKPLTYTPGRARLKRGNHPHGANLAQDRGIRGDREEKI
jgi:hypothetical protein